MTGFGAEDAEDAGSVSDLDERSFEALEDDVDRAAAQSQSQVEAAPGVELPPNAPIRTEDDFEAAVRTAIDALPVEFQAKLTDVVVTVSDEGAAQHAYGMFIPGAGARRGSGYSWWFMSVFARRDTPDQIVIYRDTLTRDFGRDPARLRAQITETVRHEVGHALGFDEAGVRRLGL